MLGCETIVERLETLNYFTISKAKITTVSVDDDSDFTMEIHSHCIISESLLPMGAVCFFA
jgi:hypothetical protein